MKVSFYKTLCLLARPQSALPPQISPVMKFHAYLKKQKDKWTEKKDHGGGLFCRGRHCASLRFVFAASPPHLARARAKFSLPFQVQLTTPVPAAGPHRTRVPLFF
jgi:hypothetical protein